MVIQLLGPAILTQLRAPTILPVAVIPIPARAAAVVSLIIPLTIHRLPAVIPIPVQAVAVLITRLIQLLRGLTALPLTQLRLMPRLPIPHLLMLLRLTVHLLRNRMAHRHIVHRQSMLLLQVSKGPQLLMSACLTS